MSLFWGSSVVFIAFFLSGEFITAVVMFWTAKWWWVQTKATRNGFFVQSDVSGDASSKRWVLFLNGDIINA